MTVSSLAADSVLAVRDRYLAPSLLSPFADDMARRLSRLNAGPVLETSADVGILTQAMASSMSAGLTIIATDPSAAAVDYASVKPGMARVAWQMADPCVLPFREGTFGIVASQFGVAVPPNRIQAFREARRVMKSGGRFVFSVPSHIRHNPIADCLQTALQGLFVNDPPRFLESVLHGYADNTMIDADLTAAGFTDAIYTTVDMPYVATSAHEVAVGFCLGTPLRLEIELQTRGETEQIIPVVAAAVAKRFGSGLIKTHMRALVVSASG